jgi:hypothetical protein
MVLMNRDAVPSVLHQQVHMFRPILSSVSTPASCMNMNMQECERAHGLPCLRQKGMLLGHI